MAVVTVMGITPTTLAEYVADLGAAFQAALGNDLDLATETPQGQLIANLSLVLSESDEGVVSVGSSLSIGRAVGVGQDDLVGLLGVERRDATRSTVTATIAGVAGIGIPQYAQAETVDGDLFRATVAANIPAGGSVDVDFEAVETGPVPAPAGALTTIVTRTLGWESITNAAAASLGRDEESATGLRSRYARHVGRNARTSDQAVEANLLETAGVTDALVRSNATVAVETEQGQMIPSRALFCAVDGGTNAAVARTIADYKAGGQPTTGDVTHTLDVLDADGMAVDTIAISFRRVADLPVTLTVPVMVSNQFPADGLSRISDGLVAYVEAQPISAPLDSTRILAPILAVPGHQLGTVVIARKAPAVWDVATVYVHPARVLGSDGAVYNSVQDSTGEDPTTDTSDTYWTLAPTGAVTDRANIRLWERIVLDAADISITVS